MLISPLEIRFGETINKSKVYITWLHCVRAETSEFNIITADNYARRLLIMPCHPQACQTV
jgi:hypothetical protein